MSLWRSLDARMRALCPLVRDAPDPLNSNAAHWQMASPAQTAVDLLWVPALAALLWALSASEARHHAASGGAPRLWRVAMPPVRAVATAAALLPAGAAVAVQRVLIVADAGLRACAWGCLAAVFFIKLSAGEAVLLLQPCHLSLALLCTASLPRFSPRCTPWVARALWVDILAKFGALAALYVVDVGPLPPWGWRSLFLLQHWVLVLLPTLWLLRGRTPAFSSGRAIIYCSSVATLIHFALLLPASLLSGLNVNYMMEPPSLVFPASVLPAAYFRSIVAVACLLLTGVMSIIVQPLTFLGAVFQIKTAPTKSKAGNMLSIIDSVEKSRHAAAIVAPRRRRRSIATRRSLTRN